MRKLLLQLLAILMLGGGMARAADDYIHTFTGFTFPPQVADFDRKRVTPYNAEKSDIEVDYDNNPYTVHLSVYVYPATTPLGEHYVECKGAVTKAHPDAKLVNEQPVSIDGSGTHYDGFSALYTFRGKFVNHTEQELLSKLIVYRRSDYFILFRISYSEDGREKSEAQIDDFITKLAWPPETKATPEAK